MSGKDHNKAGIFSSLVGVCLCVCTLVHVSLCAHMSLYVSVTRSKFMCVLHSKGSFSLSGRKCVL